MFRHNPGGLNDRLRWADGGTVRSFRPPLLRNGPCSAVNYRMPTGRLLPSGDSPQSPKDGRPQQASSRTSHKSAGRASLSDAEKKRVRGRVLLLKRATVFVAVLAALFIAVAAVIGADIWTRVFCAVTAVVVLVVWFLGARIYVERLKPYRSQLGLDRYLKPDGPSASAAAPAATTPHGEADKRQAQAAARDLRARKELPTVASPAPLMPGEVCHHFRAATMVREAVGSRRVLEEGYLILSGDRLYFSGRSTSSSIPLPSITKLTLAGPRSFGVRYAGSDALHTFDVEFPQEFLAYLGVVCHRNDIKLPRIGSR